MRITYIANTRLPTEKARGLQTMKSCEAFAERGCSVTLIAPDVVNPITGDPFDYYGVKKIFRLEKKPCFDVLAQFLARYSEKAAFYASSIFFALAAVLPLSFNEEEGIIYSRDIFSLFLLCILGFKPVVEIHNFRGTRPRGHLSYIFDRARAIVVNAPATKEEILRYYAVPEYKILVAQNGVDVGFFNIPQTREEARTLLGLPMSKTIISYVGRLETAGQEKGVADLIESFNTIHADRPDTLLCVVGGSSEHIERYQSLVSKQESTLFAGQLPYNKIPLWLRAIDIVVIPFPNTQQYRTASPIKLFEFLAAGKTIVASDLPSLRVFLNDSNALFFKPSDKNSLIHTLDYVLANPEFAQSLAGEALKEAPRHSWLHRAEKILNFIQHQ